MKSVKTDAENGEEKDYCKPDIELIRNECRRRIEQKFLKPPSEGMMKAFFEAVIEFMVKRKLS